MGIHDQCIAPGCERLVGRNGAKGKCFMHYMRKGVYNEVTHLAEIKDFDKGWFIGLFDGEGYISTTGKRGIQVGISMSDEDTIQRAYSIIQLGDLFGPYPAPRSDKLIWTIKVCKQLEVLAILQWMLPHLSIRRQIRAEEMIQRVQGGRNYKIMCEGISVTEMENE